LTYLKKLFYFMALNENPFVAGADLSAEYAGYAPTIEQCTELAVPSSTYGLILYDSSTPVVTGTYAWRKRCLWLDTTVTAAPVLKAYRTTGSPGWFPIVEAIGNNTITTAMLQDVSVTLAKLSASGGTAAQLIRVNAGATGFEFVNASTIVSGLGSINITSLDCTTVPLGEEKFVGCIGNVAGQVYWRDADYIAGLFGDAAIIADAIAPATVLTSTTKFLSSRTGDTFGVYRVIDPDTDIADGDIDGDKLTDATVTGGKLTDASVTGAKLEAATIDVTTKLTVPGSSANKILGVNSGGTAWELQTAATIVATTLKRYVTATVDEQVWVSDTYTHRFTHGLGAAPSTYKGQLICITSIFQGSASILIGDLVDLNCIYDAADANAGGFVTADATYIYITINTSSLSALIHMPNKSGGAGAATQTFDPTKFKLRCSASI
jgi:hypothetical protein